MKAPLDVDTIAILGVTSKGLDGGAVQQWLEQCSGFMKLKWNDKVNGCFAKFSSAATAEQALRDPQGACFGAEWARRNLD